MQRAAPPTLLLSISVHSVPEVILLSSGSSVNSITLSRLGFSAKETNVTWKISCLFGRCNQKNVYT